MANRYAAGEGREELWEIKLAAVESWAANERLDGAGARATRFTAWEGSQAIAVASDGRGAGSDGVVAEVYKAMPVVAKLSIVAAFSRRLAGLESRPGSWALLLMTGIPKTPGAATLELHRWIAKSSVLCKWYLRLLIARVRRSAKPRRVMLVGFEKTHSTPEVVGTIREALFCSINWRGG